MVSIYLSLHRSEHGGWALYICSMCIYIHQYIIAARTVHWSRPMASTLLLGQLSILQVALSKWKININCASIVEFCNTRPGLGFLSESWLPLCLCACALPEILHKWMPSKLRGIHSDASHSLTTLVIQELTAEVVE